MWVNGTVSVSGAEPSRTCLVAALLPDSSLYCTNRALFACVCVSFHAGPFMYLQAQSRVCRVLPMWVAPYVWCNASTKFDKSEPLIEPIALSRAPVIARPCSPLSQVSHFFTEFSWCDMSA